MPLPASGVTWPPPHPLRDQQVVHAAWYAGTNPALPTPTEVLLKPDPAGVTIGNGPAKRAVHANLAADLAAISGDLVLGIPPVLTVEATDVDNALDTDPAAVQAQSDLATLMEDSGAWRVLREAAELAAAIGEVYVRAIADPTLLPQPILEAVPATNVDPTWRYGVLTAATMWTTVGTTPAGKIWRWVERRDNTARLIENGLYLGDLNRLGERRPLTDHPATAGLPDAQPYPEGVTALVWHVPNARPSRRAPESPHGRSDLEGSEGLLATLDLTWTSLARDIRLSQARILAPTQALTATGSLGAWWDNAKEIFTPLDMDPSADAGKPELMQAPIRATEHIAVIASLVERIVTTAGYSPQTIGLGTMGQAESGTALRMRTTRTSATVNAKRALWGPAIADIAFNLAALARVVHARPITPVHPRVEWPQMVTPDPAETARTIALLASADAASVETRVRMAQPDLDAAAVEAEVERIVGQNPPAPDLPLFG
jgi:hypothetical protein